MQEHRAAAALDARMRVVIDLDMEVVGGIVAFGRVAALGRTEPHRLVVMAAAGVFAPGILGPDGADRQESARPGVAIGPPPQLSRPEAAFWRPTVAFAL